MANKLVAMFGIKYEPDWLVDQLKENLKDWVDDFAILDCRDRKDELWIHEGEYRAELRKIAREMNANWVFHTSPDERWEKNAGKAIRPLVDDPIIHKVIYSFNLREMWYPNEYRVDGIWGEKIRPRLYPLLPDNKYRSHWIQCSSVPYNSDFRREHLDINIYHLKMIEKENRKMRARVFKKLDPNNERQEIGYDYLYDDKGLMKQMIPEGREYYPKYKPYKFEVPKELLSGD